MKNFFKSFPILLIFLATGFMSYSCSDNDDDNNNGNNSPTLETPVFESISAKYEVINGDNIKSIELTESGNYVVILKNFSPSNDNNYFALARANSRGVIHGKFIKISDTEFILEGFGSIVIEGDTNNAFSLQISENGKEPYTIEATKIEIESNDLTTQNLCRTWDINNVNLKLYIFGKLQYDVTKPASQYKELIKGLYDKLEQIMSEFEDDEDDEYYEEEDEGFAEMIPQFNPQQIIFTKTGSYMTIYEEDNLAISTWTWVNSNKGVLRYSHNYDYIYDPEYSNECHVSFDNKEMTMFEVNTKEVDEETNAEMMKVTSTYFCSEAQ